MITAEVFGTTARGETVTRYALENKAGMRVLVLDYGCTIQSILVPDAGGNPVDVALGYDTLGDYEAGNCYFGAFVGRYANRIKDASFTLGGKSYRLEKNDGENHLHGVYCRRVFSGSAEGDSLVLRLHSPDGEEGFPGAVELEVRYTLREDNALVLEYRAETDAETVLNLTNHSCFNLNGGGDVLGHRLTLWADSYTESDAHTLPTGRILPVEGTPLDFRAGKPIGAQLRECGGYDHNFVLSGKAGELRRFASAEGERSGICMEAFTTQPGAQLYSGNFLDADPVGHGKGGVKYPRYGGFCLETQHYPCSPNFPQFPSTVLRPGEQFRETTVYRFFSSENF